MSDNLIFEAWYEFLVILADENDENVDDQDAWRESFDAGESASEAFYGEYPEHRKEV